jgi:ribosomal protein S12
MIQRLDMYDIIGTLVPGILLVCLGGFGAVLLRWGKVRPSPGIKYHTKQVILEIYDAMSKSIRGKPLL